MKGLIVLGLEGSVQSKKQEQKWSGSLNEPKKIFCHLEETSVTRRERECPGMKI